MHVLLNIAFALQVCGHFEAAVAELGVTAGQGDKYAQTIVSLHQRACEAAMNQAYGDITRWDCIVHAEPGAAAYCTIEVEKH